MLRHEWTAAWHIHLFFPYEPVFASVYSCTNHQDLFLLFVFFFSHPLWLTFDCSARAVAGSVRINESAVDCTGDQWEIISSDLLCSKAAQICWVAGFHLLSACPLSVFSFYISTPLFVVVKYIWWKFNVDSRGYKFLYYSDNDKPEAQSSAIALKQWLCETVTEKCSPISVELGKQQGCVQNPACHSVHTGL